LEDQRNDGESSCNSGAGTDQRVQSLMFMVMMMMMMMMMTTEIYKKKEHTRPSKETRNLDHFLKKARECRFHLSVYLIINKLDIRGSVHHSTIHEKKSNKMQQCIKTLFPIYVKLNMFRATHRPSSGS
jgi:hypothetical protein